MLVTLIKSIMAGVMIGIGGCALLSVKVPVVGAVFFALGLMTIIHFNLKLFTGAIGYWRDPLNELVLAVIYLGNTIGTFIMGYAIKNTHLAICVSSNELLAKKAVLINGLPFTDILIAGIMCGMLMYIGVNVWHRDVMSDFAKCFITVLCVAVFILCGFEHCIADMFYLFAASENSFPVINQIIFIAVVALGNALGAIVFHRGNRL